MAVRRGAFIRSPARRVIGQQPVRHRVAAAEDETKHQKNRFNIRQNPRLAAVYRP